MNILRRLFSFILALFAFIAMFPIYGPYINDFFLGPNFQYSQEFFWETIIPFLSNQEISKEKYGWLLDISLFTPIFLIILSFWIQPSPKGVIIRKK